MATAFSYAQAAKGQAPAATSAAQPVENVKDSASSANGEQPTAEPNAVKTASAEEDTSRNTTLKAQLAAKQDSSSTPAEATNNTSAAASVTDSRRDDEDAATESSARRSDKSVRSASASTRVTDEAEPKKGSRKPRKGKAGKESSDESKKEKAAEEEKEQPKIELIEAPLPSVNIWTQRKETQAAKTTVTLPAHPAPAQSNTNTTAAADVWPNSQESKKKSKTAEVSEATNGAVNGTKSQRKVGDDAAARRNGSRGSRLIERDSRTTELPPPVNDVTSWPTPETAVKETVKDESRKPGGEKTDRPDAEPQEESGKGRAKSWKPLPFVPTVAFSTPIPSTRGARGGRGGARGGRDATSRGGHGAAAAAADKSSAAPSKSGGEARERARDANAPARTNSQPPAVNKRASMDVAKEQRKAPAPTGERAKESQSTTDQAGPVRGEGRSDRGRGNFRGGRGSHPGNAPMHAQQSSYMGNGNSFGSQGPPRQYASPPLHQGGNFTASYGGSQSRGGRGGRGQSNGSGAYRGVGGSNAGRARQVQANMNQGSWDYPMPLTPATYGWYEQIRQILIPQLEYYFSIENLVKDEFLRRHMDSQGFVPLEMVLNFSRVRHIADPTVLRAITAECTQLDFVVGDDNIERIRSRSHWQKFVYPAMEQRAESARNAGPQYFWTRSHHAMSSTYEGMMGEYAVSSPTGYPNGGENGYMPYAHEAVGGQPNGQLSAQVPAFQPSTSAEGSADASADAESKAQPIVNGSAEVSEAAPMTNGNHAQTNEALQS
ncbi:La domain-containing protein [Colletotrichum karsti]|uniref:La domain-containing protein n=1 Tax=Colletotrichum karsti TaxID=1095194 RepID=A0A9P6HTB9_9PEZI|nr:La domain-containing protein [Colletotrichum karsti]KAF9869794.1 La domain-containing protein [Colletotrichum karsti]